MRKFSSFIFQAKATEGKKSHLLTATGRWDGASMLAVGNKWDFFPSVALAWKMNDENFLKGLDWIDPVSYTHLLHQDLQNENNS